MAAVESKRTWGGVEIRFPSINGETGKSTSFDGKAGGGVDASSWTNERETGRLIHGYGIRDRGSIFPHWTYINMSGRFKSIVARFRPIGGDFAYVCYPA